LFLLPATDKTSQKYFIATQNNRIYGFNLNGKPMAGWNPMITDAPVVLPIKSQFYNGKTNIIAVTNRGTFYQWDINAKKTSKPIEIKHHFDNNFALKANKSNIDKLYFMDTKKL
jgi:hypothetical protein